MSRWRMMRCPGRRDMRAVRFIPRTAAGFTDEDPEITSRVASARAWISNWRAKQLLNQVAAIPEPSSTPVFFSEPVPAGVAKVAEPVSAAQVSSPSQLVIWAQLLAGLASLYILDKTIANWLASHSIKFPSSLIGMFGVVSVLMAVGDQLALKILNFYGPALGWVAKWLPLFYVPSLITLPLALDGIGGSDLVKLVGILCVGMVGTLLFTAQTAVFIREIVRTPMKEIAKAKPSPPFTVAHYASWASIAVVSLVLTVVSPTSWGQTMMLPFQLAATVGAFLLGSAVPKAWQGLLHPVVVTAIVANLLTGFHGGLIGNSYNQSQISYLAKGAGPMGAGDLLMGFLGCVIVSFGFRIYTQRETMKRHAPEILGATLLSSLFSLYSTAIAAKFVALAPDLARAIIPRSVTVALALPIASQLDAPLSITAAAVLLQGIIGANFGPNLMTQAGIKDTIARGLAAAATAGGLGTASLTAKEPEALPFCALSYSLIGIISTLIAAIPAVRQSLVAIVG